VNILYLLEVTWFPFPLGVGFLNYVPCFPLLSYYKNWGGGGGGGGGGQMGGGGGVILKKKSFN
jgi:hypothetical protein